MSTTTQGPITFTDIFLNSYIQYLLGFLAIYIVLYFVLGMFFKSSDGSETGGIQIKMILDILVLLFVIVFAFMQLSTTDLSSITLSDSIDYAKSFAENPYSILSVFVFIVILYAAIYLVRLPMTPALKPITIMIIENVAILAFLILCIINFFKFILNIDLLNSNWDDLFKGVVPTPTPTATETPAPTNSPTPTVAAETDEVFNIRNNLYTYDEAKEVCSIYGAKLATYDQIETSYNDGGEWCNYGWSENQMALFPTQKGTWNKLQTSDATKNACGRPGINGGFMKNKNIRFGVNCYGKKPDPTDAEKALMNANIEDNIPVSHADKALKAKVDMWKKNADKFLLVNSFDKKMWSATKK
jgi:hypothetical protein